MMEKEGTPTTADGGVPDLPIQKNRTPVESQSLPFRQALARGRGPLSASVAIPRYDKVSANSAKSSLGGAFAPATKDRRKT